MKKILVTGGDGYIGAKLVLALQELGHEVTVFDKPQDIRNEDQLSYALDGKDICYHLAALAELKYTDAHPQETYEVNIVGTNNIARLCAEKGVLLNFVSTSCIYGDPLEYPSVEDRLINPTDTYAMSKASGEYLVKMWGLAKGLKYNILRYGTVYGQSTKPSMRGDMAIQKFILAAVEGRPIEITGDGEQSRNFIHLDDLVRGNVLMTTKEIVGETINFTGKESVSINKIADFALAHGATSKTYVGKRKDDFMDQDVSTEKAKRLLGWEPEVTFAEGAESYYNWLKDQANKQ